jgi:exopolysaccharide biosynthesis polyprenyl glycosylphosphotransferase
MAERPDAAAVLATTAARLAAASAAWGAAWWIRFGSGFFGIQGRADVLPRRYLEALPVALLATLVACRAAGLPRTAARGAPRPEMRELLGAAALAALIDFSLALLVRDRFQYSRGFLALHGALLVLALPAAEAAARALLAARPGREETLLLVGGADAAAALARDLAAMPGPPLRVLGRAGPEGGAADAPTRLGDLADAARIAAERGAKRVVVLDDALDAPGAVELFRALADGVADVGLAWRLPRPPGFPPPALVAAGDFAVASYWESPLRGGGAVLKRALDVALSAALLLLLSPLLLLVALLVRLTSRGPVLHRQERVGLDGRTFTMLKFRTMVEGAERETGPVFAGPGDPRRTAVGGFLRRFSLDELPQIANVLRGEMSLVGPRPERPEFVERFRREHPGYMLRHSLRAGVTGWAQVNGLRGRSPIETRLAYDLDYARRWSLLFDVEILVRTVGQVMTGKNAY